MRLESAEIQALIKPTQKSMLKASKNHKKYKRMTLISMVITAACKVMFGKLNRRGLVTMFAVQVKDTESIF